jgi:hypothetical protein
LEKRRHVHLWVFRNLFQTFEEEITNLQIQYFRLEHITRGVSKVFVNCGPKNILWELAKKTDQSKVDIETT